MHHWENISADNGVIESEMLDARTITFPLLWLQLFFAENFPAFTKVQKAH